MIPALIVQIFQMADVPIAVCILFLIQDIRFKQSDHANRIAKLEKSFYADLTPRAHKVLT